jgi:hypothetical protein
VGLTKYYRSGEQTPDGRSPFKQSAKKPNSKKRLVKVVDYLVVAALLFCLGYSLIVSPAARVEVNSDAFHSQETYSKAVSEQLNSFKNKSKMTLDDKSIEDNLKNQFPELTAVSIELPLISQTPTVKLSVAAPTFFLISDGKKYVIDSKGRAAGLASDLPHIKDLPVLIDQSGFSAQSGKQVLSTVQVQFIANLLAQLNKSKKPVGSLTLPPVPSELDLRTSDRSYYVKFFMGGDVMDQAGEYLAARNSFDKSGNQPDQYLDVRVSGKVFYK